MFVPFSDSRLPKPLSEERQPHKYAAHSVLQQQEGQTTPSDWNHMFKMFIANQLLLTKRVNPAGRRKRDGREEREMNTDGEKEEDEVKR